MAEKTTHPNRLKKNNKPILLVSNSSILLIIFLFIFSTLSLADPTDCQPGYEFQRRFIKCVQKDCYQVDNAHLSYVGDCICGSSGSIAENPKDPNKECYADPPDKNCPGCVTACVHLNEPCPGEKPATTTTIKTATATTTQPVVNYASPEEEECDKQYKGKEPHMVGRIDDWGECAGVCELGWTMEAEGCKDCNEVCSGKANHEFSKEDSDENDCTCVCREGYAESYWTEECEKLNCPSNSEVKGNGCKCKKGFKKGDDGKTCIAYDKQQALINLLNESINKTTNATEREILMEMLNNLMDVKGHKDNIIGGWNGIANTIYSILNKGERPGIADLMSIYNLNQLGGIKNWFTDMRAKNEEEYVWGSKLLSMTSQDALDTILTELNNGEHRTIKVKFTTGYSTRRAFTGGYGEEKEVSITVVKGPDGTIMYTLDGKKYFPGALLDKNLDPSFFQPVVDGLEEVRHVALDTKYKDRDKRLLDTFATIVHKEYSTNSEAAKSQRDQLIKKMTDKQYAQILAQMKSFIEQGYDIGGKKVTSVIDFLDYSIKTAGTQAVEGDFSKAAILYGQARRDGRSQAWINQNMHDQIFTDLGWKNADTFQANTNQQILLDQLEKVYQRYQIYEEMY